MTFLSVLPPKRWRSLDFFLRREGEPVLFHNRGFSSLKCLSGVNSTFSSPLLLDDDCVFDSSPGTVPGDDIVQINVQKSPSSLGRKHVLSPLVVTVFKSFDWEVARQIMFSRTIEKYGFSCSIDAFRMVLDVFALAGKEMEVNALLGDIVLYYKKANLNVFELSSILLDSPKDAVTSLIVFDLLIKAFTTNNMLENAVHVFEQAKKTELELSICSCNFLLKHLAEGNRRESVRSLFEKMKNSGPAPNVFTYDIMVNFYSKGNLRDTQPLIELLEEMESHGLTQTVVTNRTYIYVLCRLGYVEYALDCVRRLINGNKLVDVFCYNTILHGFSKRGEAHEALKLLEEMKSKGISPNAYTYNILIHGFSKLVDVEKCVCLFEEMQTQGISPHLITYNVIINGLCKKGKTKRARELIPLMLKKNILPSIVTYNTLIDGFAKQSNSKEALMLYSRMSSIGVTPDVVTYSILISMFFRMDRPCEAYDVFKKMIENGTMPDVICYTSVIAGFCRTGELKKALTLFYEMLQRGLSPDVVTYTSLIEGCCKLNCFDMVHILMDEMTIKGIAPDVVTYTLLITTHMRQGNFEMLSELKEKDIVPDHITSIMLGEMKKALTLFYEMLQRGLTPDVVTYTSLIDGCCKLNCFDIAHILLDDMKRNGIDPDVVTYTVLIAAHMRHGNLEMLSEIKEKGIVPDRITSMMLKEVKAALTLFYEMLQRGLSPDVVTYTSLIAGCCNFNCFDIVPILMDDMKRKGIAPNAVTYDVLIAAHKRYGNFDRERGDAQGNERERYYSRSCQLHDVRVNIEG